MMLSKTAAVLCSLAVGMSFQAAGAQEDKKAPALVAYDISDGPAVKAINKSLTGVKGDPARGEQLIARVTKGNCFACHEIARLAVKAQTNPKVYDDMGKIGPRLDGVASRYTEAELRMLLVNSKQVFPETIMPGFYRVKGLNRVGKKFQGQTILEPQEVEDILAYLTTLTEPQRSDKVAKGSEPTSPAAGMYQIVDGPSVKAIDKSLTGKPGDSGRGEQIIARVTKGNCFACHEVGPLMHKAANNPKVYDDMGRIGPRLDGVAARYTEGELRMLLVDSKQVFPDTIMPGFLRKDGLHRVAKKYEGKTILEPQEVEDVLAFLMKLKVEPTAGMGGMSGMRSVR